MIKVFLLFVLAALASSAPNPQSQGAWPYRDNMEYYGYQRAAASNFRSAEDDEVESGRQDLKVAEAGQSTSVVVDEKAVANNNAAATVVETGSAKPVSSASDASKVNQPNTKVATGSATNTAVAPAFPPATPPPVAPPPKEVEDSEESDEDDEQDEDDEEADEDYEDEEANDDEDRRRNIAVDGDKKEAVSQKEVSEKQKNKVQTVEALVPGYVTEQGEVLVPFDTVAGDKNVAVVEDLPSTKVSSQPSQQHQQGVNAPPVVVIPSSSSNPETEGLPEQKQIPKFFNPFMNNQIYYANEPPPGAIFTFDDDDDDQDFVDNVWTANKRARKDSSEEEEDEAQDDDSTSDEDGNEERRQKPKSPPLAHIKATGFTGEDDEADSLGIRLARMGYYDDDVSRSPSTVYVGNGYFISRYPVRRNAERPSYYYRPEYSRYPTSGAVFYYRPVSAEKTKVIPLGSFDVSLEERDDGYVPVVSPVRYNKRPVVPASNIVSTRRTQQAAPNKPPTSVTKPFIFRRPGEGRPSLLALYNIEGGTPVSRQRIYEREAKQLKKNSKNNNQKKMETDPFGLLKKVNKKNNKKH